MRHEERKYLVESFEEVREKLVRAGAKEEAFSESLHYYAQQDGNDVLKLVAHEDRAEILRLKERSGQFELVERRKVKDSRAGIAELKLLGNTRLDVVKMSSTEYFYKGGVVGLYVINDSVRSVVLDLPATLQDEAQAELGLGDVKRITVPYNKYLKQVGSLGYINLE